VSIGKKGIRTTNSLPDTGMSWSKLYPYEKSAPQLDLEGLDNAQQAARRMLDNPDQAAIVIQDGSEALMKQDALGIIGNCQDAVASALQLSETCRQLATASAELATTANQQAALITSQRSESRSFLPFLIVAIVTLGVIGALLG
jgi:hypothetical protein